MHNYRRIKNEPSILSPYMAVIKVMDDNREATKGLIKSKNNTLVYHIGNQLIILEIRNVRTYKGW